jgi:hypothetical protein
MKIQENVFGSRSEKDLYKSLESKWSKKFTLYPQLPFQAIINFDISSSLSKQEINFLYKTSVDYTLCTKEGKPVLSIEFDGLGCGFNKGGEYIQEKKTDDPYRKLKFDLKLRVCEEVHYPFFIISYEEKNKIDQNLYLTVVDGIIGQVLAKNHFATIGISEIGEIMKQNEDFLTELSPDIKHDYIQDLVTSAEVEAELKFDPIAITGAKYEELAYRRGICKGYRVSYLSDPELPEADLFDTTALERRIQAIDKVKRHGCQITLRTPLIDIIQTTWVRNFEGYGVSSIGLAENIATLLAFKRALDL